MRRLPGVLAATCLTAANASAQMPHVAQACYGDTSAVADSRIVVTPDTIVALRRLLIGGEYAGIERRLAWYDSATRADWRNENAWMGAWRSFSTPMPELTPAFDRWVDSLPASPYARIARAFHRDARAGAASKTSAEMVKDKGTDRMQHWMTMALEDLNVEMERPEPHVQAHLVYAMIAQWHEVGLARQALDSALARSPYSSVMHEQYARALRPMWGVHRDSLGAFVERAQARADNNPRLQALLGYPPFDSAARVQRRDPAAARRLIDQALAHGITGDFIALRAELDYGKQQFSEAIAGMDCAIALNPWRADWVAWRGAAKIKLGASFDGDRAVALQRDGLRDLRVVNELIPYNETAHWAFGSTAMDVRQELVQEHHGLARSAARTMRDIFSDLWKWGLFGLFTIGNLIAWRRNRYHIPRYIHVLAAAAFGVIVWLNWMWVYQADGSFTMRRFIVVLAFPFIVYAVYISAGGFRAGAGGALKFLRSVATGN